MSDITKDKFNEYCASVICLTLYRGKPILYQTVQGNDWDPFENLNQSVYVVDKLLSRKGVHLTLADEEPIQKQINDFIISAMTETEK